MKNTILSFLLILAGVTVAFADSLSDARKAYEAKDYAKAARLFEAAARQTPIAQLPFHLKVRGVAR